MSLTWHAPDSGTEPDRLVAAINAAFPKWKAFRSTAGRFWATRRGTRAYPEKAPSGWSMTVDADSAEDLAAELEKQDAMRPG